MRLKHFLSWIKRNNEFTFVIILIVAIWIFIPKLLKLIDPQSGGFSIDIIYVPIIAGVFFFVGLFFIWLYFQLVWPNGKKILDDIFKSSKSLEPWQKAKLTAGLFFCLVFLYAMSLLAVTGISAIM